jgi:hypothetical protein
MNDEQINDHGISHRYITRLTDAFKGDVRVLKKCTGSNHLYYYKSWDTNLCKFQR